MILSDPAGDNIRIAIEEGGHMGGPDGTGHQIHITVARGGTMEMKQTRKEQYHAWTAMLAECVEKCPEGMWIVCQIERLTSL